MIYDTLKTAATNYFTNLGMIPGSEFDQSAIKDVVEKVKTFPHSRYTPGNEYYKNHQPVKYDAMVFASDAFFGIDMLNDHLCNLLLDEKIAVNRIEEQRDRSQSIVGALITFEETPVYIRVHSYELKFQTVPKYPFFVVIISKQ